MIGREGSGRPRQRAAAPLAALVGGWALAVTGCAAPLASAPTASAPAAPAAPAAVLPSFAPALERGLAIAVGVYGLGTAFSPAAAPAPALAAAAGRLRRVGEERLPDRVAAGFVVSGADGLIVTAAHGIAGSEQIVVKLADQRIATARLLGEDEEADIALLQVPLALPEPPPPGHSTALRPGDWVLAIGEPYGLNRSVVAGIVGGTDRHFVEDRELLFIQSDLALNPGNSGGPLLDAGGAVVGMNTRTVIGSFGASGVSLSIPIEIVMQIVGELREQGAVWRPRLGAEFDDVSPSAALAAQRSRASGALVIAVGRGSVAARLGLQPGDIIVGMNGRPVEASGDLVRALLAWRTLAGTRIAIDRAGGHVELHWR